MSDDGTKSSEIEIKFLQRKLHRIECVHGCVALSVLVWMFAVAFSSFGPLGAAGFIAVSTTVICAQFLAKYPDMPKGAHAWMAILTVAVPTVILFWFERYA